MHAEAILAPAGILEVDQGQLTLMFGRSHGTADFGADPIERCWGILENHWNGALLTSVATALRWAGSMTWRGIDPLVELLTASYETGVKLSPSQYRPVAQRLERSETLGKWSLVITPNTA